MNEIIIISILTICILIEYFLSNKKDISIGFCLGVLLSVIFLASPLSYHVETKTFDLVLQEKDDYCSYYMNNSTDIYLIINEDEKEKIENFNIYDVKIISQYLQKPKVNIKYKISNSFFKKKKILSVTIYAPEPFTKHIDCINCKTQNDFNSNYCKKCGKSLHSKTVCKNCQTENDTDANYCEKCGEKLN